MTGVLTRRGRKARDVHSDERPHEHTVRMKPSVSQGERSQENQTCPHLDLGFQPPELFVVVVVQSLSCVQLLTTPWTAACQAYLSFTISWTLLKLMSTMGLQRVRHNRVNEQQQQYLPSWWCHPTISSTAVLLLPSIFLSIRVFSSESAVYITWPKYWSFSFSISPSNEYLGLISIRI